MRILALASSLVLTGACALAGLCTLFPGPVEGAALVALVADEKALFLVASAAVGIALAVRDRALQGASLASRLSLAFGLFGVACALLPPAEALRIAHARGDALSAGRYLRSRIDQGAPPFPQRTETFAAVEGRPLLLDLYDSRVPGTIRSGTPQPAVVVVHGGSWSARDKSDLPRADAWLSRHGFTVLDIQYRLAPQPNWKTATGDVKCAVGWVKAHAAELGVDPARVHLLGRSAGAHLALLAAYTPGDELLRPSCPAGDTAVRSVVSFYGPTDLAWGYAHPANLRVFDGPLALRRFLGGTPAEAPEAYRLASPVFRATKSSPPTLLVHGGRDQYVRAENLELLFARLRELGVPATALRIPYAQHGFDYVHGGLGGQLAEAELLRFLEAERPSR